jgi:hypothetical protein
MMMFVDRKNGVYMLSFDERTWGKWDEYINEKTYSVDT